MFIELTKITYGAESYPPRKRTEWETKVLINTETITSIEIQDNCSVINFIGMYSMTVKETIELKGKLIK